RGLGWCKAHGIVEPRPDLGPNALERGLRVLYGRRARRLPQPRDQGPEGPRADAPAQLGDAVDPREGDPDALLRLQAVPSERHHFRVVERARHEVQLVEERAARALVALRRPSLDAALHHRHLRVAPRDLDARQRLPRVLVVLLPHVVLLDLAAGAAGADVE